MVDPVNPSGQSLSSIPVKKTQDSQKISEDKKSETQSTLPVDQVSLSQEALSLKQAEDAATKTKEFLEQQREVVLSNDPERLNALA